MKKIFKVLLVISLLCLFAFEFYNYRVGFVVARTINPQVLNEQLKLKIDSFHYQLYKRYSLILSDYHRFVYFHSDEEGKTKYNVVIEIADNFLSIPFNKKDFTFTYNTSFHDIDIKINKINRREYYNNYYVMLENDYSYFLIISPIDKTFYQEDVISSQELNFIFEVLETLFIIE